MAWTLAPALVQLRAEVNSTWPNRSKASDGTIGDPAHAARTSDHNPNALGVVRALDVTARGIDAAAYAEHIRMLGLSGFGPLSSGGYVIFNRRIASSTGRWIWRPYTGSNPHVTHCHVSVGRGPAQYNDTRSWRIAEIVKPPPSEGDPFPMLDDATQKKMASNVQTLVDELFHWGEITEPVRETGARKTQLWEVLVNAGKVPEMLRRVVVVEAAVAKNADTLQDILNAVKALTPPPVEPAEPT